MKGRPANLVGLTTTGCVKEKNKVAAGVLLDLAHLIEQRSPVGSNRPGRGGSPAHLSTVHACIYNTQPKEKDSLVHAPSNLQEKSLVHAYNEHGRRAPVHARATCNPQNN